MANLVRWKRGFAGVVAAAVVGVGVGATVAPAPVGAGESGYVSLPAPARILDTRPGVDTIDGLFAGSGLRPLGATLQLKVTGRAGVPVGATAVVMNVTVVDAIGSGFITVYPCGASQPRASSLNYVANRAIPNLVVAKVGADGNVCLFNTSPTHLIADVAGHFPDTDALTPLEPARILDTRPGEATIDSQFAGQGILAGGSVQTLQVWGRGGVPSNAASVVMNVTVDGPHRDGFVTVFPCGATRPTASNVNYVANQTIPNAVVSRLSSTGTVCLFTSAMAHLIVDVSGFFVDTTAFVPLVAPARLLDTRSDGATIDSLFRATGLRPSGGSIQLAIAGRAGIPSNASAVMLNVTVDQPQAAGFVTAYPAGVTRPNASNLNYVAGQTVPNAVVARLGSNGTICLFNSGVTHLVVDTAGYFTGPAPAAAGPACPSDPALERSDADRPDDIDGPQVHLVYVLPADGVDRRFDTDGSIARSIALAQNWLSRETNGQRLRLDTFAGQPDISFVRLTKADAQIASMGVFVREGVERGVLDAGFRDPDKMYLVYYDGTSDVSCGGASYPPSLIGPVVALYLRGLPSSPFPCNSNTLGSASASAPGYLDISMLHEFVHGLGLVAPCAPNSHRGGHTSDDASDLMYAGDAPWLVASMRLDINRDDYYDHGIPGCPDLKNSAFLSPTVGPTWMPQGWGATPQSQDPRFR